jgi:hypothetical protein
MAQQRKDKDDDELKRDLVRPARTRGTEELGDVSQLEAHLGYWLRAVSNHVSHAFKMKVETHGVTVAEWVVLRARWAVRRPVDRPHCRVR